MYPDLDADPNDVAGARNHQCLYRSAWDEGLTPPDYHRPLSQTHEWRRDHSRAPLETKEKDRNTLSKMNSLLTTKKKSVHENVRMTLKRATSTQISNGASEVKGNLSWLRGLPIPTCVQKWYSNFDGPRTWT